MERTAEPLQRDEINDDVGISLETLTSFRCFVASFIYLIERVSS